MIKTYRVLCDACAYGVAFSGVGLSEEEAEERADKHVSSSGCPAQAVEIIEVDDD